MKRGDFAVGFVAGLCVIGTVALVLLTVFIFFI